MSVRPDRFRERLLGHAPGNLIHSSPAAALKSQAGHLGREGSKGASDPGHLGLNVVTRGCHGLFLRFSAAWAIN